MDKAVAIQVKCLIYPEWEYIVADYYTLRYCLN